MGYEVRRDHTRLGSKLYLQRSQACGVQLHLQIRTVGIQLKLHVIQDLIHDVLGVLTPGAVLGHTLYRLRLELLCPEILYEQIHLRLLL